MWKTSHTERVERELKCSPLLILCGAAFVLGGWRKDLRNSAAYPRI